MIKQAGVFCANGINALFVCMCFALVNGGPLTKAPVHRERPRLRAATLDLRPRRLPSARKRATGDTRMGPEFAWPPKRENGAAEWAQMGCRLAGRAPVEPQRRKGCLKGAGEKAREGAWLVSEIGALQQLGAGS